MGIISLLPGVLVLSFGLFPAVEAVQLSKRLGLKGGGSCQNACDRNSYPAVCTCNVCEGNQVARSGKKKTFQSASSCTYIATGKCKRSGKRDKETCDAEVRFLFVCFFFSISERIFSLIIFPVGLSKCLLLP